MLHQLNLQLSRLDDLQSSLQNAMVLPLQELASTYAASAI
jgi:hypothetical protein